MLRLQEGKAEEAWRDLLACHRLARLLSQGPMLIDNLLALTIDWTAFVGDEFLADAEN